jgi:hypothetical protein
MEIRLSRGSTTGRSDSACDIGRGPRARTRMCGLFILGEAATIAPVLWTTIARRLAPLVVAASCLTMMIGSSGAQTLTTMNDPAGSRGGLAPPQVALIGRRMLQTLAPTGTPTVTVFATTWDRAEMILLGPSQQRSHARRTAAELITVRGRLRRRGRPVGHPLLGLTIWIPNGARSESGVLRRVPKQLAGLGRGTTYNLTLQQPASAVVAVRPLTGIGPISLGEPRAALQRTLGPWLLGTGGDDEYVLGATELDVGLEDRQVHELVFRDANALLDGVPLRAGYRTLAEHLHGWRSVRCADEGRMLELSGAGGRVTDLLFKGNRFAAVNVGLSGAGGCPPWPPSFLASPVGRL